MPPAAAANCRSAGEDTPDLLPSVPMATMSRNHARNAASHRILHHTSPHSNDPHSDFMLFEMMLLHYPF